MAIIYPMPLPRRIEDDPMRAAERRVYEALRDGLGQEFSVFYGVAWLGTLGAGARDGEVDFVVAHPDLGVLLLEVKGGAISRDGISGRWTSVDHAGYPHPIQDPFAQVRTSKHALLEKFKEHPMLRHGWIPMGHGVVLPDSARPDVPLGPDAPPPHVVFALYGDERDITAPEWRSVDVLAPDGQHTRSASISRAQDRFPCRARLTGKSPQISLTRRCPTPCSRR